MVCGGLAEQHRVSKTQPCCLKRECQLKQRHNTNQKYAERHRAAIKARNKAWRDANLPAVLAQAKQYRKRLQANPASRAKWNAHRLAWLKKRMQDPAYKARVRARARAWHHRKMTDPAYRAKRNGREQEYRLLRKIKVSARE
jgi:hypothetical protein